MDTLTKEIKLCARAIRKGARDVLQILERGDGDLTALDLETIATELRGIRLEAESTLQSVLDPESEENNQ